MKLYLGRRRAAASACRVTVPAVAAKIAAPTEIAATCLGGPQVWRDELVHDDDAPDGGERERDAEHETRNRERHGSAKPKPRS